MGLEFDPVNKHIKITSGVSITALELYNATMDWCDAQDNMGYDVPMTAVGKAPLGGGVYTDSIFILQNGWKIKLYDGTYTFTVLGTLITEDETPRTVPPDSGNVEVIFQVTSQGTISEPVVSEQDKLDIADKVWDEERGVDIYQKVIDDWQANRGRWKLVNNQMIFYDTDNTTPLYTFNLFDDKGQPSMTKVYERVPV